MVTNNHYRWDFIGLSTDVKPTPATSEKVVDGSTFYCSDTSKLYVYCKDNWYERKPLGGGGGGSYTAGNGINISDDTISVDTTVVQEKLTAGSNITIENNVISASGGTSASVVQSTGTSTTDVMSQDATTKMVYPDFTNNSSAINLRGESGIDVSTGEGAITIGAASFARGVGSVTIGRTARNYASGPYGVTIGSGAKTDNTLYATALGSNATVGTNYGVALGSYATTSRVGEVNVGAGTSGEGYNSTNYRVLGGVHDGQLAQDAVTVSQVNATIDAINTALSTNIPHIGA